MVLKMCVELLGFLPNTGLLRGLRQVFKQGFSKLLGVEPSPLLSFSPMVRSSCSPYTGKACPSLSTFLHGWGLDSVLGGRTDLVLEEQRLLPLRNQRLVGDLPRPQLQPQSTYTVYRMWGSQEKYILPPKVYHCYTDQTSVIKQISDCYVLFWSVMPFLKKLDFANFLNKETWKFTTSFITILETIFLNFPFVI